MDALLHTAVEEVALEGRQGCPVDSLWSLLSSRLPVGSIEFLAPSLKAALWQLLLKRTDDIELYVRHPDGPSGGTPSVARGTPKPATARKSKKGTQADPLADADLVPPNDPCLATHETAAAKGVLLVASEAVRHSVLGVYEMQDSRFPLSDTQLAALEAVGRARYRGTINADLANRLGVAYRNFHYIVKNLETRQLVVKNPVVFAPPGGAITVSSVLHLPRYQPAVKLGPGQMFKTVDAVRGMEVATYVLQDDNLYMRLVCDTIAETAERLVVEADLKLVCGFRGVRGHRMWRRLRRKLEELGHLQFETCNVRGRMVPCVRLLKDWRPLAAAADEPGEGGEGAEGGEEGEAAGGEEGGGGAGGGLGSAGCLHIAERSLERQLLDCIISAGPEGVLNSELFARLGVSSKNYQTKLVAVLKRHRIQVMVVSQGRSVLNRLVAPPELLAAARVMGLPVDDGGRPPAPPPPQQQQQQQPLLALPAPPPEALEQPPPAQAAVPEVAAAGAGPSGSGAQGQQAAAPAVAAAAVAEAPRGRRAAAAKSAKKTKRTLQDMHGSDGGGSEGTDGDEEYTAADAAAEAEVAAVRDAADDEAAAAVVEPEEGADGGGGEGGEEADGEEEAAPRRRRKKAARTQEPLDALHPLGTRFLIGKPQRPVAAAGGAAAAAAPGAEAAAADAAAAAPAAAAAAAAPAGPAAAAPAGPGAKAKPHWTKIITLRTEDRLRLLQEHLHKHRFIPRAQVRRLVMEWESEASGKPIPTNGAGPDVKTIRRLMDRLVTAGKARILKVETPGFLGDNRPIETLLRPDIVETPELLDEIRVEMAQFEHKLRSESCRRALAARKAMLQFSSDRIAQLVPKRIMPREGAAALEAAAEDEEEEGAGAGQEGAGGGAAAVGAEAEIMHGLLDAGVGNGGPARMGVPGLAAGLMPPGMARGLYRVEANASALRTLENGLLPAKMVRVRLLHFFMAKLVGLGGWPANPLAAVDVEPSVLHHLQLGEDVLGVMAGASAGSGSRMAFAFGAMPATGQQKAHVHQYGSLAPEDRERRRLAALQHAGLATAAAAAAAAGGGAGGGADGEQRLLSVRRMWASMPLGLALQILGSTSKRSPEELAELCETGTTLGSLTAEQAKDLMDPSSIKRLEYLIGMLRRLRLCEWVVVDPRIHQPQRRPGPGAGIRTRGSKGVMLRLTDVGILEIPPSPPGAANTNTQGDPAQPPAASGGAAGGTAAAADGAATDGAAAASGTAGGGGGAGLPSERYLEVELASAAGLDRYWTRFEELFRLNTGSTEELQRLKRCFPATIVPEVLSRNGWYGSRLMTAVQWLRLQAGLNTIDLDDGAQITALAAKVGVDVDIVARVVYDRRRRVRHSRDTQAARLGGLGGLGGDDDGGGVDGTPRRLGVLGAAAAKVAAQRGRTTIRRKRGVRRLSPRSRARRDAEKMKEREERREERRRRRELAEAAKEAKRAAKAAKRARQDEEQELSRGLGLSGDERKKKRRRKAVGVDGEEATQQHGGGSPHSSDASGYSSGGTRIRTRRERGPSSRPLRLPATAAPTRVRRILWTVSEDRVVLNEWVRMAAVTAPKQRLPWKRMAVGLPYSHQACFRHVKYLRRNFPYYTVRLDELARRAWSQAAEAEHLEKAIMGRKETIARKQRELQEGGEAAADEATTAAEDRAARAVERTREILGQGEGGEGAAEGAEKGEGAVEGAEKGKGAAEGAEKGEGAAEGGGAGAESLPLLEELEPMDLDTLVVELGKLEVQLAEVTQARRETMVEAEAVVEDLVQTIPRGRTQQARELLQQHTGVLGEASFEQLAAAHERRRAAAAQAAALRREQAAAGLRKGKGATSLAAAGDTLPPGSAGMVIYEGAVPQGIATGRGRGRRRAAGGGEGGIGGASARAASAATGSLVPALEGVNLLPPLPLLMADRPSLAETAAMSVLVSLLYQVRSRGLQHDGGWMSRFAVDTLADFGRRFPPDVKAGALRQLQLRGWLSPAGSARQLDLTTGFLSHLHGAELPQGLFARACTAAGRLDRLLEQAEAAAGAAAVARRYNETGGDPAEGWVEKDVGQEAAAAAAAVAVAEPPVDGEAVGDGVNAGAAAVEKCCALDPAYKGGVVVADAGQGEQEQLLPSELVSVLLVRQALGAVELLPGDVELQPATQGHSQDTGLLCTTVVLSIRRTRDVVLPGPGARVGAGASVVVEEEAGEAEEEQPQEAERGEQEGEGEGKGGEAVVGIEEQAAEGGAEAMEEDGQGATAEEGGQMAVGELAAGAGQAAGGVDTAAATAAAATTTTPAAASGVTEAGGAAPGASKRPHAHGDWAARTGGAPPSGLQRGERPLFAPSAVAADPQVFEEAQVACREHLETAEAAAAAAGHEQEAQADQQEEGEVGVGELLCGVLTLLDAAEHKGLRFKDLMSQLAAAAGPGGYRPVREVPGSKAGTVDKDKAGSGKEGLQGKQQQEGAGSMGEGAGEGLGSGALVLVGVQEGHDEQAAAAGAQEGGEAAAAAAAGAESAEGVQEAAEQQPATPPLLVLPAAPRQARVVRVVQAMERHGLLRRLGGWDAVVYATAQHSQQSVVQVQAGAGGADAQSAAEGGTRPEAGVEVGAEEERLLRPWVDHKGAVNDVLWRSLLQRLLGVVMRRPGISEELLLASMHVMPPQATREVLHHLVEHGRLTVRTAPAPPLPGRPRLLGGAWATADRARPPTVHYFPVLEQLCVESLMAVAPPL